MSATTNHPDSVTPQQNSTAATHPPITAVTAIPHDADGCDVDMTADITHDDMLPIATGGVR